MSNLVMLDLCSGLGGASQAMMDRGWRVIRVDVLPWLRPTVVADVRALPFAPFALDLVWASPPCEQYTRLGLPRSWHPDAGEPDLSPWRAIVAAIEELRPRWWVIENGRMARHWWGPPDFCFGPRRLWSNLPMLNQPQPTTAKNAVCSGQDPLRYWKRSKIPYPLSEAVAATVEELCGAEHAVEAG